MSGQPVDTRARNAFLDATRALAPDLSSDKEAVFMALLTEVVCGFLIDNVASLQGVPLTADLERILMKVGVVLNQRFMYQDALKSARDLAAEVREGPTANKSHVITNLEDTILAAKTLFGGSPVARLIHALGCCTADVGASGYGTQLARLELLVPLLLATQALYRLKLVTGEFPVQHYFGEKVQALRGSQTLWDILNEFGVASTKKMLLRSAQGRAVDPFLFMTQEQCLDAHDWIVLSFDNLDFKGRKTDSITIAMFYRIPWRTLMRDGFYSTDRQQQAELRLSMVPTPLEQVTLMHYISGALAFAAVVKQRVTAVIKVVLPFMHASGDGQVNAIRVPVTRDFPADPSLPVAQGRDIAANQTGNRFQTWNGVGVSNGSGCTSVLVLETLSCWLRSHFGDRASTGVHVSSAHDDRWGARVFYAHGGSPTDSDGSRGMLCFSSRYCGCCRCC